jgi:hypothetical protein
MYAFRLCSLNQYNSAHDVACFLATVLARLEAFLPQMASANSELLQRAQQNPESVNIEHIDDTGDGRYIEMVGGSIPFCPFSPIPNLCLVCIHSIRSSTHGVSLHAPRP